MEYGAHKCWIILLGLFCWLGLVSGFWYVNAAMLLASSGLPILWAVMATAGMHEKHMAACILAFAMPLNFRFSMVSSRFAALKALPQPSSPCKAPQASFRP